ncbi:hypothetical protein MCOR25_008280 [Pyricularia grisea]|uniref:Uncharacterized protein n=1 Tax=Pyricularia grisea TaxID=148305 RepID=A0A6P8B556_PYRGI|nr:hypothetical protein PgNI_05466 [Pyricularia grisea]KAI6355238.1 hypothetical protein MCOR25_008280 [Pyricularia grisea]TLD10398.1 hypothetical protein PgNI_05466 [Pyricularia grisea]
MQLYNIIKVIAVTTWGAQVLALPAGHANVNEYNGLNAPRSSGVKARNQEFTESGRAKDPSIKTEGYKAANKLGQTGWFTKPNAQSITVPKSKSRARKGMTAGPQAANDDGPMGVLYAAPKEDYMQRQ